MSESAVFENVTFHYAGYRVLVTGGSNGIGHGIAHAFADAGAHVTITGTNSDAGDYDKDLSRFAYVQMRATDKESIAAVGESVGALDILINNAGGPSRADPKMGEFNPDSFEESVTVNLTSYYRLSAMLRGKLAKSRAPGGASIIGIGSLASFASLAGAPGYTSAKTGLVGLTRALGDAFAQNDIRVNTVAAGLIRNDLVTGMMSDPEIRASRLDPFLARTPLRRIGEPMDIAGPTLFLCSPAAAFITGQTLIVDGGYSIRN